VLASGGVAWLWEMTSKREFRRIRGGVAVLAAGAAVSLFRPAWIEAQHLQSVGFAYNNLGTLLFQAGNTDGAMDAYERSVATSPVPVVAAMRSLGDLYLQRREYDRAERYMRRVIELRPASQMGHEALVRLYETMVRDDRYRVDAGIRSKLADAYRGAGRADRADHLIAQDSLGGATSTTATGAATAVTMTTGATMTGAAPTVATTTGTTMTGATTTQTTTTRTTTMDGRAAPEPQAKTNEPVAAPGSQTKTNEPPAKPQPPREKPQPKPLSEQQLAALVGALSTQPRGTPVWFAVYEQDEGASGLGRALQEGFAKAGWAVRSVDPIPFAVKGGVFLFAADEEPAAYVRSVYEALQAAGIQPNLASGYRSYSAEMKRTKPGWRGFDLRADQTYLIVIGPTPRPPS